MSKKKKTESVADPVAPLVIMSGTPTKKPLFAGDAEIVGKRRDFSVGVNGNVKALVHGEVVARPMPDDAEVVDEREVEGQRSA